VNCVYFQRKFSFSVLLVCGGQLEKSALAIEYALGLFRFLLKSQLPKWFLREY